MLKKLLGETALYGLSSIIGRALNFLLLPFYTGIFLPGEYGVVTDIYVLIAFLNIVFTFGMETTFFRYATKHKSSSSEYFRMAQSILLSVSLLLAGAIFLLSNPIAHLLGYGDSEFLIRCMALILLFDALAAVPFARLRLEGKAWQFASYRLSSIAINIFLNIFFLLICPRLLAMDAFPGYELIDRIYDRDFGVGYVLLSNVISNSFFFLYFLPTWRRFRPLWDRASVRQMIRYSSPLIILGLAGITNEMLSRQLIKYILPEGFYPNRTNLEVLGIFGAAYKLSVFMTLVVQAFKYAYEPFFFKNAAEPNSRALNSKVMTAFVAFTCGGWIMIITVLPELAPIFLRKADYLEALGIVPILLGAGVLLGIFYNLSVWYKLTETNWYGAIITTAGAAVTIALNVVLIPHYGYMGSAWASLFTYLTMVIISYLWGQRIYPVPYQLLRIFLFFGLAMAIVMALTYLPLSVVGRYALGFGAFAVLAVAFWKMEKPKLLSTFER